MIEFVSPSLCIECNICVQVCPMNVFEVVPDAPPRIARKSDCQTCYMCEAYCPTDALYVAPDAERSTPIDEQALEASGLLGSYRKALGWTAGSREARAADQSFRLLKIH